MVRLVSMLIVGSMLAMPAVSSASNGTREKDALVLEPTSEWSVRQYDDKCRVRRTFGSGENRTSLWLDRGGSEPVVLETGPLTEALAQLSDCSERLLQEIAANGAGGTPVQPTEIERWAAIIQQNDPRHLLRAEQEASIMIALNISPEGKPAYCEVTQVTGLTSFNDTVCLLMLRHATFDPARNAAGEPVVGRYSTRVTFKINR